MIVIKILGKGCPRCKMVKEIVNRVINKLKIDAKVEEVKDLNEIAKYGVLITPGLVINEKLVMSGRIPTEKEVEEWIKQFL